MLCLIDPHGSWLGREALLRGGLKLDKAKGEGCCVGQIQLEMKRTRLVLFNRQSSYRTVLSSYHIHCVLSTSLDLFISSHVFDLQLSSLFYLEAASSDIHQLKAPKRKSRKTWKQQFILIPQGSVMAATDVRNTYVHQADLLLLV